MVVRFYALERIQRLATYQITKMMAIAGISKDVFDDLLKSKVLTLELKSAHNVNSVLRVSKGSKVFVTHRSQEDVVEGIQGIVAEVKKLGIMKQKVSGQDESEVTIARIQLSACGIGKVRRAESEGVGKGLSVEVEETVSCEAS